MTAAARELSAYVAALFLAVALGATAVSEPQLAIGLGLALVAALVAARRARLLAWDLLMATYAAAIVLGYGFANLGIAGRIPIPLAEIVLLALLAWAVLTLPLPWRLPAPFWFAALFVVVASLRLLVDYREFRQAAVRDYTLALELGYLFVGYCAFRVFGVDRWVRALRWVFVLCLVSFIFYPWRNQLAALGPTVGLQKPVPLLGDYAGAGPAAVAGFFFFAMVRPFGPGVSYAVAAAFLPAIAMLQLRGLYLALPAAAVLIWLFVGQGGRGRLVARLAVPVLAGLLLVIPVFWLSPQGRLERVSPDVARAQLGTLVGESGPGEGSLEHRIDWFHDVVGKVQAKREGWLVGVGLGPDLATGFESEGILVRKPHNDYLEVYARLGVPGISFLLGVFASALVMVARGTRRAAGHEAAFLWFVLATTFAYLTLAATQPFLWVSYATIPLLTTLGAGIALAERKQIIGRRGATAQEA